MAGFLSDFFGGGQPNLPYNPPQMPERFLNPSSVPEMQMNDFQRGIVSDKRGWDTANRTINFLTKKLDTPDLTDLQKQYINDKIQESTQARDAFAASANERRANAQALGIDTSDYDSGKTLQESAQAYNTYKNAAIRDFLNLPTVAQLEENRYRELRNRGASPAQADRILKRERAGREEEFLRRTEEGIMTYGTNSDGSLNQIGLQLARRMNPSDPQIAATLYANAFAMPKNIFTEDRADKRTLLNNQSATERAAMQLFANMQNAQLDRDAREKNLFATIDAEDKRLDKPLASNEKIALLRATAQKVSGGSDKDAQEIQRLIDLCGGDEEKAINIYLRQHYDKYFKALEDGKDMLKDKVKFGNFVGGQFATVEYYLQTKDYTTAKNLIGQFRESIMNPENKYSEIIGAADTKALLDRLQMYEDIADGKNSLEKLKELEAGVTGDSWASLQRTNEYHRDTGTYDDAQQKGQKAAEKARLEREQLTDPKTNVYDNNTVIFPWSGAVTLPPKR